MALPTHKNFQLAPYIFEEDLDNISIPNCVSAPSTTNTEEEFNDYIEANGYFMIGTYVDTWSGLSQFNKAGCPPVEPGTYEDAWANFIITYPDSVNPRYRISSLLKDDGTRMAEVWHSSGDYANNPCGNFGPTFSEECYKDAYGRDRTLYKGSFVTSISIYRQISGFTCPPNSHYENGECIPDEGYQWCEEYQEFCPIYLPDCLNIYGPSNIENGNTYTYTVEQQDYDGSGYLEVKVYLSYLGSSMTRNVDYTAPDYVIIPSGSKSVTFNISYHTSKEVYDLMLNITIQGEV